MASNGLTRKKRAATRVFTGDLSEAELMVREATDYMYMHAHPVGRFVVTKGDIEAEDGGREQMARMGFVMAFGVRSPKRYFPWLKGISERPKLLYNAAQRRKGVLYQRLVEAAERKLGLRTPIGIPAMELLTALNEPHPGPDSTPVEPTEESHNGPNGTVVTEHPGGQAREGLLRLRSQLRQLKGAPLAVWLAYSLSTQEEDGSAVLSLHQLADLAGYNMEYLRGARKKLIRLGWLVPCAVGQPREPKGQLGSPRFHVRAVITPIEHPGEENLGPAEAEAQLAVA